MTNPWHDVTISLAGENLQWNNAAGLSWGLELIGTDLWSASDSPCDGKKLRVQLDGNGEVVSISFFGELFKRTTSPLNITSRLGSVKLGETQ